MDKPSCWITMNCGKGPGSDDPCIVASSPLADGFLDGENGSRACFYLKGTTCYEDDKEMSIPEKMRTYCIECPFFRKIQETEGVDANIFYFLKHIHDRLLAEDRIHELPVIQRSLFHNE